MMAWEKEWLINPEISKIVDDVFNKEWLIITPEASWPKGETISIRKYNNLSPTHDPYTNPNAHIYYECSCGAILDPGTKSFAALNNAAMDKGWKVRWGSESYVPYCVKCSVNIED